MGRITSDRVTTPTGRSGPLWVEHPRHLRSPRLIDRPQNAGRLVSNVQFAVSSAAHRTGRKSSAVANSLIVRSSFVLRNWHVVCSALTRTSPMNSTTPSAQTDRVRRHSSQEALEAVEKGIEESIRFHSSQPVSAVTSRIEELEKEWSMERWLETNASVVAFSGVVLGLTVSKKWFALPLVVTGFLFLHAVQGWCPPVPVLRRLGVRTRSEIDREKFALKVLRGDFKKTNGRARKESIYQQRVLDAVNA